MLVVTEGSAAMEGGDGERQAGGLAGLYSWPRGFLFLGTVFNSSTGLKKALALSRGLLLLLSFEEDS